MAIENIYFRHTKLIRDICKLQIYLITGSVYLKYSVSDDNNYKVRSRIWIGSPLALRDKKKWRMPL